MIGNLCAILLAVVFVHSRILQAAYFPVVLFFNTIPILALSPIIILIFGLGMTPKIVIAAIICFFPTLINMIRGLEFADRTTSMSCSACCRRRARKCSGGLRLPRAMPMLFSSLRIASATAVIGAIVGEWIGSDKGLGALIIQATFQLSVRPALCGDRAVVVAVDPAVPRRRADRAQDDQVLVRAG